VATVHKLSVGVQHTKIGAIELRKAKAEEIADLEIRNRYTNGSRNRFTQHFLAVKSGKEVGFLSVDINPEVEYLVIYGLFVPTALRRQGVATQIVEAAEDMGRNLGYRKALLVPKSLDGSFAQLDLEKWYRHLGYRLLKNGACQQHVKDIREFPAPLA
jgi:GNAT superfamily N-acetyltransferase